MFARSIAIFSAALVFSGMAVSQADAWSRGAKSSKRVAGCCAKTSCYKKVVRPAVYKTVVNKVLVEPARCSSHHEPAVYRTETHRVLVKPEERIVHTTPAQYGTVHVNELVNPGYSHWQHSYSHGSEYRCLVEVPAQYRVRTEQVLVREASHYVETRPAITDVVKRKVLVAPAVSRKFCKPAIYKKVVRKVLVQPASEKWVSTGGCGTYKR